MESAGRRNGVWVRFLPEEMRAASVAERRKARGQMAWAGQMNNCVARAVETILADLIYV